MRGDVYEKVDGVWTKRDNIKGPPANDPGYIPVYDTDEQVMHDASTLALFTGRNRDSPFLNTVTGAVGLTAVHGTLRPVTGGEGNITAGIVGPFGRPSGGIGLAPSLYSGAAPTLASANGVWEPPGELTVAMWVQRLAAVITNSAPFLIHKPWRPSTWTVSPYTVFKISLEDVEQLVISLSTTNPTTITKTFDALAVLPLLEWTLLSVTYSPTAGKLRVYVNGRMASEDSVGGALAWQTGANASPWVIGAPIPNNVGSCAEMFLGPLWIEGIARSADYELLRYKAGARRY